MQKIEIKGLAQLSARGSYKENKFSYGGITLNGKGLEDMIAREIFGENCDDPEQYRRLEELVNVTVIINADVNCLKVNGNEVPIEGNS